MEKYYLRIGKNSVAGNLNFDAIKETGEVHLGAQYYYERVDIFQTQPAVGFSNEGPLPAHIKPSEDDYFVYFLLKSGYDKDFFYSVAKRNITMSTEFSEQYKSFIEFLEAHPDIERCN